MARQSPADLLYLSNLFLKNEQPPVRSKNVRECPMQRKPLEEFIWVPIFSEKYFQIMGIPEPVLDLKKLEEVLKPRPTVLPIIRRKRRVQIPAAQIPTASEADTATTSTCSATPVKSKSTDNSERTCTFYSGSGLQSHKELKLSPAKAITTCSQIATASEVNIAATTTISVTPVKSKSTDNSEQTCTFYSGSDSKCHQELKPSPAEAIHKPKCTARKSTGRRNHCKQETAIRNCKIVLLDLANSNLRDLVKQLIAQMPNCRDSDELKSELRSRTESQKRSESTDSGLATDEETPLDPPPIIHKTVPPLKLSTLLERHKPHTVKRSRQKTQHNEERRSKKIKTQDERSHGKPKTGGAAIKACIEESPRPPMSWSKPQMKPTKTSRIKKSQPPRLHVPQLKMNEPIDARKVVCTQKLVSSLLNNQVLPVKPRFHYLLSKKDLSSNPVNPIALPSDVVATSDFDLPVIEVAPLCLKRSKEPPPLTFFSPYDQKEKDCCISCNQTFKTKQELAKHKLAHHSGFSY